jgi:hypothetical protein
MIVDQRAQLFQSFGSIATTAADAATEGIQQALQTDSTSVNTALKLFGGFDRSEFESIHRSTPNLLVPAVRPPASYEGPADYLKPLSNTTELEGLLVPVPDLLRQLGDSQFRMSDGLSAFSDHRITQGLLQKGMIFGSTPVPEDGKVAPIPDDGKAQPVPEDGKWHLNDRTASLEAFGKLYMMEHTAAKQLQLLEQLDFGALSRLSVPQNPRLNQGLKGMPDAQSVDPQPKPMLDLPLHNAMNDKPATVGEFLQMINVLQTEVRRIQKEVLGPFGSPITMQHSSTILRQLQNLENMFENVDPNLPPSNASLEYLRLVRQSIKLLLPVG